MSSGPFGPAVVRAVRARCRPGPSGPMWSPVSPSTRVRTVLRPPRRWTRSHPRTTRASTRCCGGTRTNREMEGNYIIV